MHLCGTSGGGGSSGDELMPMLLLSLFASPRHQPPCYWLFEINRCLFSTEKDFNCLRHFCVTKWQKMQICLCVSESTFSATSVYFCFPATGYGQAVSKGTPRWKQVSHEHRFLNTSRNLPPFCRRHIRIYFIAGKVLYFDSYYTEICCQWSNWQEASIMMTSSNGNIFRLTSPLCGEITGHRWIPLTKASDTKLRCFLWSAPEPTAEQTMETPVIWDGTEWIMALFANAHMRHSASMC